MRTPYTYIVRFKPLNIFYYGVRYGRDVHPDDLWDTYFTSSATVRDLLESHGPDSFEVQVRRAFDSPEEAVRWEAKVIRRMRLPQRVDFLNLGGGINGAPSAASRKRAAEKMRAHWSDPHYRERLAKSSRAAKQSGDYLQRQSDASIKMWRSEEYRRKWSAAREAMWADPIKREKCLDGLRSRWQSEGQREQHSARMRRQWQDQEFRDKVAKARRPIMQSTPYREAQAEATRQQWQDPGIRAAMIAARTGSRRSDETKERMSISQPNRRRVIMDGEEFHSLGAAARHAKVAVTTILYRCKSDNFPDVQFKKDAEAPS